MPIPLVLIVLVNTIFINMPNILVRKPPIIRIIVDLINLFFIIKYMYKSRGLEMASKNIKLVV